MKKTLFNLIVIMVLSIILVGCNKATTTTELDPCASGHNFINGSCIRCGESDPNYNPVRNVKTYVDYTFDELEVGDILDLEHDESGYFEYYEGAFIASSKDADGNVWIRTEDKDGWGLAYTNIYNRNTRVNLKNFMVQFDTRLVHDNVSLDVAADGGVCLLWNSQAGRYDLAIHFDGVDQGRGVNNSISLWHAMNTTGGPFATTKQDPEWGDRGSLIDEYSMSEGVTYTITVCGKHQGIDEDGNEFFTLYVFVNDKLVCYQRDIVYWDGGFGLRGYISGYEYANFKVSDFPLVCPDGIDHYSVDDENAKYSKVELSQLDTPELYIDGTTLGWNEIDGAEYYSVIYNGKRIYFTKGTTFDFSEIYGEGKFKVIASPSEFTVNASDTASIEFKHDASRITSPVLSFDSVSGKVTWNAVDNATQYEVYVDGELITTQTGLFYRPIEPVAGTYSVTVKAITDKNGYLNSEMSQEAKLVIVGLDAPVITIDSNTIRWNAVENATKYLIYVNDDEPIETEECSFTLTASDFRVKVKAIDTTGVILDSAFSNEISSGDIIQLDSPILKVNNNVISWNKVENAIKYGIYKNGVLLEYTNDLSYQVSVKALYSVKAIGDGALIKDSSFSNEFVYQGLTGETPQYFYSAIENQKVGDQANFGWNEYNAKYVIKEKSNGITWFGTNDPSVFHETWFWAKQVESDNTSLVEWTFESYVKLMPQSEDDAMQLMFGTAAQGGRYSVFFYFQNGDSIEHSSMQLWKDGSNALAYSWDTSFGGTGALGNTVELIKGEAAKITINHAVDRNGKARITVFVNDIMVIDQRDLVLAVGDFGLWLNAGVDGWFGNPTVTTLKQPEDSTFVGAPIVLEAPTVKLSVDELSWSKIEYAQGYAIYLDGTLVAALDSDTTTYKMKEDGNYRVRAIGNGTSIITSAESNSPDDIQRNPLSVGLNYENQQKGEIADFGGWNSTFVITEPRDQDGITWIGHNDNTTSSDYLVAYFWANDLSLNEQIDYLDNYAYSVYVKPLSSIGSSNDKVQLYIGTATNKYAIVLSLNSGLVQVYDCVKNEFIITESTSFTIGSKNIVKIVHTKKDETNATLMVYVNGQKVITTVIAIAKGDFGLDMFGDVAAYIGGLSVTTTDEIEEQIPSTVLNYGNEELGEIVDFSGWNSQFVVKQTKEKDGVTWFGAIKDGNNTYNQAYFNAVLFNGSEWVNVKNFTYTCHIMPKSTDQTVDGKVQLYIGTDVKYSISISTKLNEVQIWNCQKSGWESSPQKAVFNVEEDNIVSINQTMNEDGTATITIMVNGEAVLTHVLKTPARGNFGMDVFSDTEVWFGNPEIKTTDRY